MNILYYCEEYPPARNGGIGTVVKLVAEAMIRRGHRVVVAGKYWDGKGVRTIECINGVEIIRWHKRSYNSLYMWLCDVIGTQKAKDRKTRLVLSKTGALLNKIVNEYAIDIVETPDYVDEFIHYKGIEVPRWECTVPRIIRVHGSVSFLSLYLNGSPDKITILQDQSFFAQSDAICAVSIFAKDYVEQYLTPGKAIGVIYNPIADNWFNLNPDNQSSQTILFFGKVAKNKGVFSLIKAFNLIAAGFPQVKLKIIGSGDLESAGLLVDPQFTDRVVFEGFMPQELIKEEIDRALFCVLPSYFENFSMAALEVLARKKALIYTSRASGSELIDDGQNGLLVDPDDIDNLSKKIGLLLSDIAIRDRLAENGYIMCRKRFSTKTIIPQLESYYKETIERCRC